MVDELPLVLPDIEAMHFAYTGFNVLIDPRHVALHVRGHANGAGHIVGRHELRGGAELVRHPKRPTDVAPQRAEAPLLVRVAERVRFAGCPRQTMLHEDRLPLAPAAVERLDHPIHPLPRSTRRDETIRPAA